MNKYLLTFINLLLLTGFLSAQKTDWKITGEKIVTPWAEKVDPANPLPEYPRPQMVRSEWKSLNGLWDYAITANTTTKPSAFQGKILVPFAIESALSGVKKTLGRDSTLWYRTTFTLPSIMKGKNILLHFGAVDWSCDVYINDIKIGTHQGGYDPFSFDITSYCKKGSQHTLELSVIDPVDNGPQPRGKQVRNPRGIWYTSVTGIWQTVWLEAVPKTYIISTKQMPDIDKQVIIVSAKIEKPEPSDLLSISAWDGDKKVSEAEDRIDQEMMLPVTSPKLWSPDSPFLYDLKVTVIRNGKIIDEVKSYFEII